MGIPMAKNLHKAGMLAAVWNRTAAKAAAHAAAASMGMRADVDTQNKLAEVL